MAKTKGKSSGDFVWRANSLEEKRNEKNKIKQLQEEDIRSAMQNAQTEALRYKRLAMKYIAMWRDAIKRQ